MARARGCAMDSCRGIIAAMAHTVESILERGLHALGELMEQLATTHDEDRDRDYAQSLTIALRACCEVSRDQRETLAAAEERKFHDGDLQRLLVAYLSRLPEAERAALLRSTESANRATLA